MNYKVTYEAIAPVHIGTGEEWQKGIEFSKYQANDQDYLGIWDVKKLRAAMQADQFDRFLRILASGESSERYISAVIPKEKWGSLFSRKMQLVDPIRSTLKPQMHNGLGEAYIPGSSLKGAILTAIIAKEAESIPATLLNGLKCRDLEKVLWHQTLGEGMSYVINRFLKVGDVDFSAYQTQAWLGSVLNLNHEKIYEWKDGTDQMIECIAYGAEAEGRISMDLNALMMAESHPDKKNRRHKVKLSKYLKDLHLLTTTLNTHQLYWLEKELAYIQSYNGNNESEEKALVQYINDLKSLRTRIGHDLKPNEAILRVGAGSGYKALSGEVLNRLEEAGGITSGAHSNLVYRLRDKKYRDLPFPKTRKVFKDGVAWGFLKLRFDVQN